MGRRTGTLFAALTAVLLMVAGCTGGGTGSGHHRGNVNVGALPSPSEGPSANLLGAKWDWSRVSSFTPYLHQISGGATFYELVWCDVEKQQGSPDWKHVDRVAKASQQLGFTLYLKIRVGTCWATGGRGTHVRGVKQKTESAMPLSLAAYRKFVHDAVARYSKYGVHEYAIENEVNSESMWSGTPGQLSQLITAASQEIHAVDPHALVVDPGISSTAYGDGIAARLLAEGKDSQAVSAYQAYYARRFSTRGQQLPQAHNVAELRAALNTAQARRNLTYLALVRQLAARHVVDVRQIHFYERWSSVPALLSYLHAETPAGVPIEAWEVGNFWPNGSTNPEVRATEVVKTTTQLLAGGVRRVIWLPLAYDPRGRHPDEVRYGLLDPNGGVRPAGRMIESVAALTHQASVRPVDVGNLRGIAFERGGKSTLVVWSATSGQATIPATRGAQTATLGARPHSVTGAIHIGQNPTVVTANQPLAKMLPTLR
jgi:hypothetical protein